MVYFVEREELVPLRINQDKEQFIKNKGLHNLDLRVASAEIFIEDCLWAQVIYLHGGHTVKLMAALKKYKDIKQIFLGKIIAGDSAGANVLGRLFYSKNSQVIGQGLGILSVKLVAHYEEGPPNPLADIEPQLETIFLREYEIKVLYL